MAKPAEIRLTARELTALSTATTTATAGAAVITGPGFIDGQGAALDFLASERRDGGFSAFGRGHGDETKTARASAHAIGDEVNLGNRAVLLEQILQIILGGVEGKISHVQFGIHYVCVLVLEMPAGFRELFPHCRVSNHH
jgi:hypothetical protein